MKEKEINKPLVSVCIPMYNVAEYIKETMDQISKQSYKNIEIVLVDDHSKDDSYAIAEKYVSDTVKLYRNPKKGGNSARNFAFEKSNGEYIKFMDADDYCTEDMIEKQLERIIKEGTELTLIHSPLKMLELDGSLYQLPRKIDKDYMPGIELLVAIWSQGGFNVPHCHLMHRNLVVKSGGWDENMLKNQDGEFFARVAAHADKALSVDGVFAIWRQTKKGVSTQTSLKALSSVIDTFEIITNLLITYQDTPKMHLRCSRYIGGFVYLNYPAIDTLMPKIEELLNKNKFRLILPDRKILNIFRILLGWKIALRIIKKMNL